MKNSKKGISLIVLIITIIVIIILATAILVSVISNNTISEANKARYESDRDNMQAVFTNTVGKIMAENQGVVNVTAGQINTETTGVNETTGEVAYTVDNATVAANSTGTIKFDKGTNDATTYYTGKKLPIYAAGETKWYVDSEGVLSLEVAGVKYGSGEVESTDEEETLVAGLYDENNVLLKLWNDFIGGINIEENLNVANNAHLVMSNKFKYRGWEKTKLIISKDVDKIGRYQFYECTGLKEVIIPGSVTEIGMFAFQLCTDLTTLEIQNGVQSIGAYAFQNCTELSSVTIPDSVTSLGNAAFEYCTKLSSVTIPDSVTSGISFYGCTNLTSINYTGMQEQWNNLQLSVNWNYECPEITVHCTDGDIIIPANT